MTYTSDIPARSTSATLLAAIAIAHWLRSLPAVQQFIAAYLGERPNSPDSGAVGTPW